MGVRPGYRGTRGRLLPLRPSLLRTNQRNIINNTQLTYNAALIRIRCWRHTCSGLLRGAGRISAVASIRQPVARPETHPCFEHLINVVSHWCEVTILDQAKLLDEVNKVLEARVEVGLRLLLHNQIKVRVVDVGVYTKEASEDPLHSLLKVGRERIVRLRWKDALILQLRLNPHVQPLHVLWCGQANWYRVLAVSPSKLIPFDNVQCAL